ncbi:co-chaperone GroES [Candidatus Saccharibacteria bacterium]|nr:co-chaperone GroES [Candidatus Saccharibacteria bacterium]
MSLKPLKDRIVAKVEKPAEKTSSGLLLPSDSKEKPAFAVVESVGPDVKSVKKGDKIIYKEYSTTPIKIDKEEFLIVEEKDVLATLN